MVGLFQAEIPPLRMATGANAEIGPSRCDHHHQGSRPAALIIDQRINTPCPVLTPKAPLRMGFISGAAILAPITTAMLSASNPRVAIIVAAISSTKKPKLGSDDSIWPPKEPVFAERLPQIMSTIARSGGATVLRLQKP